VEIQDFPCGTSLPPSAPQPRSIWRSRRAATTTAALLHQSPGRRPGSEGSRTEGLRVLEVARQATELGAVWCLITGGEPLLREDLRHLPGPQAPRLSSVCSPMRVWSRRRMSNCSGSIHRATWKSPSTERPLHLRGVTRRPGSWKTFVRGSTTRGPGVSGSGSRPWRFVPCPRIRQHLPVLRGADHGLLPFRPRAASPLRWRTDQNREINHERLSPEEVVALERARPRSDSAPWLRGSPKVIS